MIDPEDERTAPSRRVAGAVGSDQDAADDSTLPSVAGRAVSSPSSSPSLSPVQPSAPTRRVAAPPGAGASYRARPLPEVAVTRTAPVRRAPQDYVDTAAADAATRRRRRRRTVAVAVAASVLLLAGALALVVLLTTG